MISAAFSHTCRVVSLGGLANDYHRQLLARSVLEMDEYAIRQDIDPHLQDTPALAADLDNHVGAKVVLDNGDVLCGIRSDRVDDFANRHMSRLRRSISASSALATMSFPRPVVC